MSIYLAGGKTTADDCLATREVVDRLKQCGHEDPLDVVADELSYYITEESEPCVVITPRGWSVRLIGRDQPVTIYAKDES